MDGDLSKLMRRNQASVSESAKYILYQILKGLYYMHSCGVIHGDLKSNCILVDSKMNVKLTNFRLSRHVNEYIDSSFYLIQELCYKAPEIILNSKNQHFSSDIWAAGCIFAKMIFGRHLFSENNQVKLLARI